MIDTLIDLLIVFLFLLFLEHCFGMTFRLLLLYMSAEVFGYYFRYRFGLRFRHLQIRIQIHECVSRLKNEFRRWIYKLCNKFKYLSKKAITGESLLIESKFLEKLQSQIAAREENLSTWCDVSKTKMFVWFFTYYEKQIPRSQVFNLTLYIFGKHKELRCLGWCANYVMETYSDGVAFHFKNYLVHRNSSILLKGLNIKYCNWHFCETFLNFS